jgi:hypothetical protein
MRGFLCFLACFAVVLTASFASSGLVFAQDQEGVFQLDEIRSEYGVEAAQHPDPSIWWRTDASAGDMRGFYYFSNHYELRNGQWYLKHDGTAVPGEDDQAACGKRLGGRLLKLLRAPLRLACSLCSGSC